MSRGIRIVSITWSALPAYTLASVGLSFLLGVEGFALAYWLFALELKQALFAGVSLGGLTFLSLLGVYARLARDYYQSLSNQELPYSSYGYGSPTEKSWLKRWLAGASAVGSAGAAGSGLFGADPSHHQGYTPPPVNPLTGLPWVGGVPGVDIEGNSIGAVPGSGSAGPTQYNPMTGLPWVGDVPGIDMGGHLISEPPSSHSSHDRFGDLH